jgi:SAM-dependent methyltransferase
MGLAALLSGCDKYLAFDVVKYANTERNLQIFDELVALFQKREAIPGEDEFPRTKPYLDEYAFPSDILGEDRLQLSLDKTRIEKIRAAISNTQSKDSIIQYTVPWYDANTIQFNSVDLIYSQAVLEHVEDLRNTYKSMHLWLKPTGYISHQIDFKCHGTADEWNGHWQYSDFVWKLVRGRRLYFLNREPHSTHIALMKN